MTLNTGAQWAKQTLLPSRTGTNHFTGTRTHQQLKHRQSLQVNQALVMVQAVPGLIPPILSRYQPDRSRTRAKPTPQQLALLMATCCLDTIVGKRSAQQVAHLFEPSVVTAIETWAARMRRRNLLQPFVRGQIIRVRAQLVSPSAMECNAVLQDSVRSHAFALRIERVKGRWRVTDLHLPHFTQFR